MQNSKEELFMEHVEHSASQCSVASSHVNKQHSAHSSHLSFSISCDTHDAHGVDADRDRKLEEEDFVEVTTARDQQLR